MRGPGDGRYDLVVIGGGSGGLVSSLVAAGVGARVALVERERTGGDCLWTGCVPSKSLLAAADLAHRMRHADRLGLTPADAPVDLAAVMAHVDAARTAIAPHDSPERLRREGVDVIEGDARFDSPRSVRVGDRRLRFGAAIVATGSAPVVPDVPGLAAAEPLTSETVWDLRELPRRLLVVGGGPIGCELGQAFARLGARVTLVQRGARLVPRDEPEAADVLAAALRRDGVDLRLGTQLEEVRGATAVLRGPGGRDAVEHDRILVAAGRAPRTAGLGLDAAGVQTGERGAVAVDGTQRTSDPRILAVGDVTGGPEFTHRAAHQARVAALNAVLRLRRRADEAPLPWVTFTSPEVAHVGLTVAQARERWGDDVTTARADYTAVDRAVTAGATEGFALLVGDRRARIAGATIVGAGAGESIAEIVAWMTAGRRIDAVSQVIHAYPTYAEAAARAADGHLRTKYATPRTRRLLRPVLAALRRV